MRYSLHPMEQTLQMHESVRLCTQRFYTQPLSSCLLGKYVTNDSTVFQSWKISEEEKSSEELQELFPALTLIINKKSNTVSVHCDSTWINEVKVRRRFRTSVVPAQAFLPNLNESELNLVKELLHSLFLFVPVWSSYTELSLWAKSVAVRQRTLCLSDFCNSTTTSTNNNLSPPRTRTQLVSLCFVLSSGWWLQLCEYSQSFNAP